MSDETGYKRRAEFACLNKACVSAEGAGLVYELPMDATHCPRGHKRLKQLISRVAVLRGAAPERDWRTTSSNKGARQDVLLEPSFRQHEQTRVQSADIHSFEVGNTEREVTLPGGKKFVRPSRTQLAEMFGVGGKGREMTPLESGRMARNDPYSVPALINKPAHRRALERHTQIVKEG